jgi:hypothetical protein
MISLKISRKKARIQGTVSEIVASENFRNVVARRRHVSSIEALLLRTTWFIKDETIMQNNWTRRIFKLVYF